MSRLRVVLCVLAIAQSFGAFAGSPDSFEEFRRKTLERYKSFRSEILENYEKFLEGTWVNRESQKPLKADEEPKPFTVPTVEETPAETPVTLETPAPPEPEEEPTDESPLEKSPANPAPIPKKEAVFDFKGMSFTLPQIDFEPMQQMEDTKAYAMQWRELSQAGVADDVVPGISDLARNCGLNDYLTMEMVISYVKGLYPDISEASRMSLVHYIMCNMGYDVRLGATLGGDAVLLLPFKQTVYGRVYLLIDDNKYYVFGESDDMSEIASQGILTCDIPSDIDAGALMDLRIKSGLNLPENPVDYSFEAAGLKLQGTVNGNIYALLYRYPQMPIGDYAESVIMPEVREDMVEQFKKQLAGMDATVAAEKLLHFIQTGFDYATDTQQFSFEKPFFVEETLFYPQCDCEDRALLYGYLLWNVLGIENHIIFYPGHESLAAVLSGYDKGDSYEFGGKRYFISDPTFIGATHGMCMPRYRGTKPEIDFQYTQQ